MDMTYNVYLVKDTELFQVILDKIQAAKPGELIPLTREEYQAWEHAIQIKKTVPTTKCKRTFRPEEEQKD